MFSVDQRKHPWPSEIDKVSTDVEVRLLQRPIQHVADVLPPGLDNEPKPPQNLKTKEHQNPYTAGKNLKLLNKGCKIEASVALWLHIGNVLNFLQAFSELGFHKSILYLANEPDSPTSRLHVTLRSSEQRF